MYQKLLEKNDILLTPAYILEPKNEKLLNLKQNKKIN